MKSAGPRGPAYDWEWPTVHACGSVMLQGSRAVAS